MFNFFQSKYLFWFILIVFISSFLWLNRNTTLDSLSSDVWMNNFVLMQDKEHIWSYVPPAYNQEKYYLAYPLFYWLNPGLEHSLAPYFILAIIIIVATYIITGLVLKKIFNNWAVATLGSLLVLLPRYICFTNIGMLSFRNLRGLALVFPFYLLIGHYWILYGIKNKTKNILLAILAGLSVYLYPPFGVLIFPFFILSAVFIYRKKYWQKLALFVAIYLITSSLFWFGHFSSGNLGTIENQYELNQEQTSLQIDIMNYRIPDGSLRGIDFGTVKRTIVDTSPLLILFIYSIFLVKKYKNNLSAEQIMFSRINLFFTVFLLMFVASIELVNYYLYLKNLPPFFIEHLRLMRAFGFVWVAQAVLVVYILRNVLKQKFLVAFVAFVLVFGSLYFSAPIIRKIVRLTIPQDLRYKYNLALENNVALTSSFVDLQQAALWSRYNLSKENTKFFVFSHEQEDFKFKILSHHDTNLTVKEGSLWVTSSFENSQKWYKERKTYDEVVNNSEDFSLVIQFAKELNCNYLLLPYSEYPDLFVNMDIQGVEILYSNDNYKILKFL